MVSSRASRCLPSAPSPAYRKPSPGEPLRRHFQTNFGKNCSGSFFFDARDGLQQGVRFPELFRAEPGSDLDVQGFYLHFEEIEMAECVPQEKTVMVGKAIPL